MLQVMEDPVGAAGVEGRVGEGQIVGIGHLVLDRQALPAARSSAWSIAVLLRSTPTTRPPGPTRRASSCASSPVPQPRSRTLAPGLQIKQFERAPLVGPDEVQCGERIEHPDEAGRVVRSVNVGKGAAWVGHAQRKSFRGAGGGPTVNGCVRRFS